MDGSERNAKGDVALSLVPRSPSPNSGYEVRLLQSLNPNCYATSHIRERCAKCHLHFI